MRILFFSSIFPHGTARVLGTFNLELCKALARDHDVRVVSPRPFIDVWRSHRNSQDSLGGNSWVEQNCGLPVSYPTYFYVPKVTRSFFGSYMWHSTRSTLQSVAAKFHPDAIVSYWAHPDGEVGRRLGRQISVPSVVMIGGSDVLQCTNSRSRRAKIVRVLKESDGVVTVSEALRRRVIELGTPPDRAQTIYQGVNCEHFDHGDQQQSRRLLSLPADRRLLLWVGRMVEVKGLDILIAAVDQLRRSAPDVLLLLVGDGCLRKKLESNVRRRGLENHVRFVGPQEHTQLPHWYRASDVTLLSSWSEGLPNVLRESLSCGRPFVSTDVGSVHEIADPHGGPRFAELVPPGNTAAIAQAIGQVLYPSYRVAAESLPRRDWKQAAQELVLMLRRLRGDSPATGAARKPFVEPTVPHLNPQFATTAP